MSFPRRVSRFIKYVLVFASFPINQISTQLAENIHMVNVTRSDNFSSGDKINLLVVNSSACEDVNAINSELSADCRDISQPTCDPDQNCCLECICLNQSGSFILNEKKCSDGRKLRQDCSLVFGSWSWSTGWLWNSDSGRLPVLYLEDEFGIEAGFNVSTDEYSECTFTSLSIFAPSGVWSILTVPANESFVNFFKLRGYWHVSWIIENLRESKKEEIAGKFAKLDIICETSNETNGIVEVTQLSSCLVFKVTGNISYEYNFIPTTTSMFPSITDILVTTAVFPIQSTDEQLQSLTNTLEPTSSTVIQHITPSSSRGMESSSATQSSSVINGGPVINSTPVPMNSRIIKDISATKSSLVTNESSVVQTLSTHAITNFNTTEQPKRPGDQFGLILGIVVAATAAVVISVAVIVLTMTSLYNSHVKRTQIIQNDANNIHMASLDDKTFPAHI